MKNQNTWLPIEQAPQDDTTVDLWCEEYGERYIDMRRIDLGDGNIFYADARYERDCVRNATHFMIVHSPNGDRISD